MKLIVGLGNPGLEYHKTRHNVGFMVIDNYAEKRNISIDKCKFNGIYADIIVNGEKIIFLKPQSFINLSGEVIKKFMDFYKIPIENIFVIHDDLDIPLGKYKLKASGSSGGHNGLKNIESCLGSNHYQRLKIGISNNKAMDTKDYVLGKFSIQEEVLFSNILEVTTNIIDDFLMITFDEVMNKYNHR